jgi:hypothetical protein
MSDVGQIQQIDVQLSCFGTFRQKQKDSRGET